MLEIIIRRDPTLPLPNCLDSSDSPPVQGVLTPSPSGRKTHPQVSHHPLVKRLLVGVEYAPSYAPPWTKMEQLNIPDLQPTQTDHHHLVLFHLPSHPLATQPTPAESTHQCCPHSIHCTCLHGPVRPKRNVVLPCHHPCCHPVDSALHTPSMNLALWPTQSTA